MFDIQSMGDVAAAVEILGEEGVNFLFIFTLFSSLHPSLLYCVFCCFFFSKYRRSGFLFLFHPFRFSHGISLWILISGFEYVEDWFC